MKSEKTFWLTAVITYTVAWGWSFLFANAYFWDDWASFYGKTPAERRSTMGFEEKHFLNPIVNPFLMEFFGIWMFRLLIFGLMFGAGFFMYKIVLRLQIFSVNQSRLFALVFLLAPVNHARYSIQTFEYSFSYFFFFLGWYLILLRKPVWRVCAIVAFLVAIGTPSLTAFMILPLGSLFYLDRPQTRKEILRWFATQLDIFLLVASFTVFFRSTQGDVEKYSASTYGLFYSILFGLVFGVFSVLLIRRSTRNRFPIRRRIIICSGIALVWLGTVPYWSVGYDPLRALPEVFQLHAGARIQAGEFFTLSMSGLKLLVGFLVSFLLLSLIKKKSKYSNLIIPNIFIILYLLNNYFVGPLEWDSRLQLLWPIGLSLLAVGLLEIVPSRFNKRNAIVLVCLLTVMSSLISAEYFVDSLKQDALIAEIKAETFEVTKTPVLVSEYKNFLNARQRTYRVGEWSGIVNSALIGDDNVIKTFLVLKDDQSCPVSYRAVALYPRVKSSFIEALFKRKVNIELGRIDLPIVGYGPAIRACPER